MQAFCKAEKESFAELIKFRIEMREEEPMAIIKGEAMTE